MILLILGLGGDHAVIPCVRSSSSDTCSIGTHNKLIV